MNVWNEEDCIMYWNCFCANNVFMNNMLNSGIFDLPSNTKAHSCAFERILGCYFKKTLEKVESIDRHVFDKIFLNQDPIIIPPLFLQDKELPKPIVLKRNVVSQKYVEIKSTPLLKPKK